MSQRFQFGEYRAWTQMDAENRNRETKKTLVPIELIASKIYLIRNTKVMLDRDLAELYGVETRRLKEQVRRNIERFPEDFMFELTKEELKNWRSQFATSNQDIMGLRIPPFVFTEHGILMLSSVLKSERAVQVNIQIMRTFTKLREALLDNKDLRRELEELKQLTEERFQVVFETLDRILTVESKPKKKIGFTAREKQKAYGKETKN
jgi:phage regulator Rha-like protein